MNLLGIDIGSSSVKTAILRGDRIIGAIVRTKFSTRYDGVRAEVDPGAISKALASAIAQIGSRAKRVDLIALGTMAPAWLAMDKKGKPLTPMVTHQDRRSVNIAKEIEKQVGKQRHLRLAGNRPFPGGISSTTWAWFLRHQPGMMKKADLCGHLPTFLHRQMTHSRVTDPSNASFMGLYRTLDQSGWSEELMEAAGAKEHQLPQIIGGEGIGGLITRDAGRRFGLTHGTPMTAGLIDTSSAMLFAGAEAGRLLNSSGSTDVLALCVDRAKPHERLLTRALGVGMKWMSVSTIAAAGSSLTWTKEHLFMDLSRQAYQKLTRKLAAHPLKSAVCFEPYLAGDRTSIEQRQGAFTGLTLSTTREQMLSAVIESLAQASAQRIDLLTQVGTPIRRQVIVSGGLREGLGAVLHRDWPGKWSFREVEEASLRGLGRLI